MSTGSGSMARRLSVEVERFPLKGSFRISRGARTEAVVVTATIEDGALRGRGECVPYARYGETVEGVRDAILGQAGAIAEGLDRAALQEALPNGAARNAIDCALWDLEAKRQAARQPGSRVWDVAGLPAPRPVRTVYTISLDEPAAMGEATRNAARSLLKVKLGAGDGRDDERIRAVRAAAPQATIIVDANEGWRPGELERYLAAARAARVAMVEQPLPAGRDGELAGLDAGLPIGADESVHTRRDLAALRGKYDVVNIKLDKAGGLTEALALAEAARAMQFDVMVGCMMATSLSMAPALLVAQTASFVDLDGPLWMAKDREHGLHYDGETVAPPEAALWG